MVMAAAGHLGAFTVEVAGLAAAVVSSREYLRFGPAQETGRLEADLIVDLGGGQPLFPAPAKRDGYLRCDPRDPVAVQRALYEATGLVGEFEKPQYVAYDAAHLRALALAPHRLHPLPGPVPHRGHRARRRRLSGSIRSSAPAAAPAPASARPALPPMRHRPPNTLLERLRILLGTYLRPAAPIRVLLVHEDRHGGELIAAMARAGRGLPARVLPFAVAEIAQLGFEIFAAAIRLRRRGRRHAGPAAAGATRSPASRRRSGYVAAMLEGLGYGTGRAEPLCRGRPAAGGGRCSVAGAASRRCRRRLPADGRQARPHAAGARPAAPQAPAPVDLVPLPAGAPFGNLQIDVDGLHLVPRLRRRLPDRAR